MIQMLTILTQRELFLLIIGVVTYVALFVVTWQNSRRKMLLLQERLDKVKALQTTLDVEQNKQKIEDRYRRLDRTDLKDFCYLCTHETKRHIQRREFY